MRLFPSWFGADFAADSLLATRPIGSARQSLLRMREELPKVPWVRYPGLQGCPRNKVQESCWQLLRAIFSTLALQKTLICLSSARIKKSHLLFLVPDVEKLSGNNRKAGKSAGRAERTEEAACI